jgi:DNA-binding XRE family transcriptional regulator
MAIHRRAYPNLEMYLRKTGVTHETLGKRVGVSGSFISHIRNGIRVPSLPIAAKIAEECNIPIESLLISPRKLAKAS